MQQNQNYFSGVTITNIPLVDEIMEEIGENLDDKI